MNILQVPIEQYEPDFTFIINEQKINTNRLIAELISPKISKLHLIDPTINEYHITTHSKGNFENIIKLVKFNDEQLKEEEIPFIVEILDALGNTSNNIIIQMEKSNNKDDEKTFFISKYSQKSFKSPQISQFL